ncbi:hypothetical protein RB195_000330 [Necator americanus]|uniref:Serpin domain-containing protein n=1 Tax=Necator americanus TaxID=51031 RepID=A0ABR1D942_NECAM
MVLSKLISPRNILTSQREWVFFKLLTFQMVTTAHSENSVGNIGRELTQTQVLAYANALLEYGLYVVYQSSPLVLGSTIVPSPDQNFPTSSTSNICVSPLQMIRAWALLSLVAVGKTKKAADKFLRCITSNLVTKNESIHEVLYTLQRPFVDCPQCIRLFSEHQPAVPINRDILKVAEKYYGTDKSPPFTELSFAGDDDGMASTARINLEAEKSSGRHLNFVVREENGPNRRAQMVLVSAIDCTFYWKFDGKQGPLTRCPFYLSSSKDAEGVSYVDVWPCEGQFRFSNNGDEPLLELESHVDGFKLYLYRCNLKELTAISFFQAIDSLPSTKSNMKICVPRLFVMFPLRLSECTNTKHKFGLPRIFDREKSDLSGIFYRSHSFYPYFVTLWEHYHKAKFKVYPGKPKPVDNNVKQKGFAKIGVAVEERLIRRKRHHFIGESSSDNARFHKYFEYEEEKELLNDNKTKQNTPPDDSYMKFDTPFFFMVVKEGTFGRMVHCVGRFNNVTATDPFGVSIV